MFSKMNDSHDPSSKLTANNDQLSLIPDEISLDISSNQINGNSTHKAINSLKSSGYSDNMIVISESDFVSEVVISDVNGISDSDHESHSVITNGDFNDKTNLAAPSSTLISNDLSPNLLSYSHTNEFKLNPNPKKFGKFRILHNEELNSMSSESISDSVNQFSEFDASNCDLTISNEIDISSSVVEPEPNNEIKAKRRGRPKKVSIVVTKTNDDPKEEENKESINRRRSTRLRNLEEKKENSTKPENPLAISAHTTDSSLDSNLPKTELMSSSSSQNEDTCENSESKAEIVSSDTVTISPKENDKKESRSKSKQSSRVDKAKTSKSRREKSKPLKSLNKENKDSNGSKNLDLSSLEIESRDEKFTSFPSNTQVSENYIFGLNSPKYDSDDSSLTTEKMKSRWRRNSELENSDLASNSNHASENDIAKDLPRIDNILQNSTTEFCPDNISVPLPHYHPIDENIFLFERKKSKSKKETKRMVCDCILTKEERTRGQMGCGEDCLNRMLMIECGSRCPLGDHCSNKRFHKKQNAKVEPFKTLKKGWGLRTLENLQPNTFIMEYVGEVIDPFDFHDRVEKYAKQKLEHHYFMALKSDEIIDATCKGNITRFVNHSCEPNSVTQKWTVNGELRIGFFTIRYVNAGEEITFDYQFQRYGKKAQKCYCGSESCRGYIGGENANILTDGSKIPKKVDFEEEELESDEEEFLEDIGLDEEINALVEYGGLRNRQQILVVSRLMLRAEKCDLRLKLIDVIMSTIEIAYLRLFIDYHGLQIVWSWMVEAESIELKARLLELLEILPIPNKTMLMDCKVYSIVERWAQKDSPESQQFLNFTEEANKDTDKSASEISKHDSFDTKPEELNVSTEEIGMEVEKSDESSSTGVSNDIDTITADVSLENNTDTEKKTLSEISKFSSKIVIKSKSKSNTDCSTPKKTSVSIGYLAQKLLSHWKDLKEVFRIPRLERQKRHDDEEEADRRTKEDEERRAQGLPIISDKRNDDDRDYTIAGILGNKRRCLKKLTDSCNDYRDKRNVSPQFFINMNSSNQNSINNRLSKEEHRKMFEYNLAQSDYAEALKKYHEDLALYNATFRNQIVQHQQMMQQLQAIQTDSNFTPTLSEYQYSNDLTNSFAEPYSFPNQSDSLPRPYVNQSPSFPNSSYFGDISKQNNQFIDRLESSDSYMELSLKDIVPKYGNPLIVLSTNPTEHTFNDSNVSSFAIDNVDFSQVRYDSDDLIESMEKKMFDEIYPPEGIFYVTSKGNTYFMSLPNDISQPINVKENVTEPLPLSFTKRRPEEMLPYNWNYNKLQGHVYYYNKRKHIKQWHPPQDDQIDSFDGNQRMDLLDAVNDMNQSNSNSPIRNKKFVVERDRDSDFSHEELEEFKRKNAKRYKLHKIQETFRIDVSQFVVKCLNPFLRNDCKKGHITNNDDFKYLARKLTHCVVSKEMKQCKHIEDLKKLACTESVKTKTKDYVKKYMSKFGPVFKTDQYLD